MTGFPELSAFQHDFIRTIYGAPPSHADLQAVASQPGFAVYRNTILKGCVDNLAANFPTVLQLVGEVWFRAAALEHACATPPRQVSLFDYGREFPDFLGSVAEASGLPYLADVARLDLLWIEAHTAADAPALHAMDLANIPPEELGELCLVPHPAARWIWFPSNPAYAIWSANRAARPTDAAMPWQGDGALLTRADDVVRWQSLEAGAAAFLDACAGHASLAEAAETALSTQPALDIAATLATLIHAGAFHSLPDKAT